MPGLQGTFPQFKNWLSMDSEKCQLVLESNILIHNFCTNLVTFSKFKTVFDPEYACMQTLSSDDHIREYYLCPEDYHTSDEEDANITDDKDA